MDILLLSRPIINGGDFLFSERAKQLLQESLPQAALVTRHLLDDLALDYINLFDKIIIAGGPLYDNRFLGEESTPLFKLLPKIKSPIHFFCNGWYGCNIRKETIYTYRFRDDILNNLKQIENTGGSFSCRDYITESILRNNGLKNIYMTGCAAWYDMENINNRNIRSVDFEDIRKIVISDQGITKDSQWHGEKFLQVKELIKFIQQKFQKAKIVFTFNGGINTKYSGALNRAICDYLNNQAIPCVDLSGGMDGFRIYDDSDLHIGFRVHSHIYCLSQRIPSILLEEDARGGGVNQALGLPDIANYEINEKERFTPNPYMLQELDGYLEELKHESLSRLQMAIHRMNDVYRYTVQPYIRHVIGGE